MHIAQSNQFCVFINAFQNSFIPNQSAINACIGCRHYIKFNTRILMQAMPRNRAGYQTRPQVATQSVMCSAMILMLIRWPMARLEPSSAQPLVLARIQERMLQNWKIPHGDALVQVAAQDPEKQRVHQGV